MLVALAADVGVDDLGAFDVLELLVAADALRFVEALIDLLVDLAGESLTSMVPVILLIDRLAHVAGERITDFDVRLWSTDCLTSRVSESLTLMSTAPVRLWAMSSARLTVVLTSVLVLVMSVFVVARASVVMS